MLPTPGKDGLWKARRAAPPGSDVRRVAECAAVVHLLGRETANDAAPRPKVSTPIALRQRDPEALWHPSRGAPPISRPLPRLRYAPVPVHGHRSDVVAG